MIYCARIEVFLHLRWMLCRQKCLNWIILSNWTVSENHIWGLTKKNKLHLNLRILTASLQQLHFLALQKYINTWSSLFMVSLAVTCPYCSAVSPALLCLQHTCLHMYEQHDGYGILAHKIAWGAIICFSKNLRELEIDTSSLELEGR